ncbi:hypothetical protein SAICODRAFT_226502 [Saitoella complicata NRRL Y-17804]|uniref:Uncharacterized protein n=1 Tax=Saitoella complicata (strain BCRC 22490 / CBS 7301 / JCM 7358 / NBRC 10748 / NRRL Y-17804) TaxID=698492 RepID=A0A0E9NNE3_SAICN|nr:uncharacterized protein SAICODRAFT_226502 [Saitoella complicata NRRL Y-17804]ODQ51812.1 hypothetical protein SAICODRAFT_226502 [Saitoella complicata NRRL Y-17804]GAO51377.1 hypothetical protein G7K_5479-t1 [Saitoella complicata NRRL Y-17804]
MFNTINNVAKAAISILESTAGHIHCIIQVIVVDYMELLKLPESVVCETFENGQSKMIDTAELTHFVEAKQAVTAALENVKEALLQPKLKEAGISFPVCDTIDLVNAFTIRYQVTHELVTGQLWYQCSKRKTNDSALRKSKRSVLEVIDYLGKLEAIVEGQLLRLRAVKAKKPVKKRLTPRQFLDSMKVKTEDETRKEKGALLKAAREAANKRVDLAMRTHTTTVLARKATGKAGQQNVTSTGKAGISMTSPSFGSTPSRTTLPISPPYTPPTSPPSLPIYSDSLGPKRTVPPTPQLRETGLKATPKRRKVTVLATPVTAEKPRWR